MTPAGQRHYPTVDLAKAGAQNSGQKEFVVIGDPRGREFAWIAPIEFYQSRGLPAMLAGIRVLEVVKCE